MKIFLLSLTLFASYISTSAQSCYKLNFQHQSDIASNCFNMVMTMKEDNTGRDFLYVANKEAGLKIYDISDLTNPIFLKQIPISSLEGLQLMSLSQSGNYLYLALGTTFNGGEQGGFAVVDVTDPANAVVIDSWKMLTASNGAGIVEVVGDYAFLGGMSQGLIIFDVSDKNNIDSVGQVIPDIHFPETNDPNKVNARGMAVKNDKVYLAYDAGGFRIIDVTDKTNPIEIGQYSNPEMDGKPRAYNNVALNGTVAYVAIDYCGMEVLDVSDPANITLLGWWKPWGCANNNWFTSRGHTNEIAFDEDCNKVFMSTGHTDVYAVDVSNPAAPDSCGIYGGESNGIGTWGVSIQGDHMFLSYICTLGIPFASNWTGVKALTFDRPCASGIKEEELEDVSVFPNPATSTITISDGLKGYDLIEFYSIDGSLVKQLTANNELDVLDLNAGLYFVRIQSENKLATSRFVKE